jgi:hypothetical protein
MSDVILETPAAVMDLGANTPRRRSILNAPDALRDSRWPLRDERALKTTVFRQVRRDVAELRREVLMHE